MPMEGKQTTSVDSLKFFSCIPEMRMCSDGYDQFKKSTFALPIS